MASSMEFLWEALHEPDARFAGAMFSPDGTQAALLYSGSAARSGMLTWQKNKLKDTAEIQLVRFRDDEPQWGAELGADLNFGELSADQVYRALAMSPMTFGSRTIVVRHSWTDDRWIVYGFDRESGERMRRLECVEPERWQVAQSAGADWMVCRHDGRPPTIESLRSDDSRATLKALSPEPELVVLGDTVLATDEDGVLRAFGSEGKALWSLPAPGAGGGHLHDAIMLCGDSFALAEPGSVRMVSLATGQVKWQAPGLDGPILAVRREGEYLSIEDATSNKAAIVSVADGSHLDPTDAPPLLHWCEGAGRLFAVTFDGGVVVVDAARRGMVAAWKHPDVQFVDVAFAGDPSRGAGRLCVTGVQEGGRSMVLMELDPESGAVRNELELEGWGEVAMQPFRSSAVATHEVILRSALGVGVVRLS